MSSSPFNPDLATGAKRPVQRGSSAARPLTVWQLTQMVKQAIENTLPTSVHVVGQLSNFKRHTSGHLYFTLKDDRSELACVCWRSAADKLKFKPTDGMDVVVTGQINLFERAGRYQLYARKIEPRGIGALELAFRQLCEKLQRGGLFDPKHKKPIPRYPRRIAIVTSPTGAAVQDILDTLRRRYPCAHVFLYPVLVQGPGAAKDVARAIADINRRSESLSRIDVMIVGRGGGSIEDLWAFNEEAVARAIFASRIPIISAVGHETDQTVADLVADIRAATPTAAAELAVPLLQEVLDELAFRRAALDRAVGHKVQLGASRVESTARLRVFADPACIVRDRARRLDDVQASTDRVMARRCHLLERRFGELELTLQKLAPDRFVEAQGQRIAEASHRLQFALVRRAARDQRTFTSRSERLARLSPERLVERFGDRLAGLEKSLRIGFASRLRAAWDGVRAREARLGALGYKSTLARGFSLTRSHETGGLIRSVKDVRPGDHLVTDVADGSIDSRVVDPDQPSLFD